MSGMSGNKVPVKGSITQLRIESRVSRHVMCIYSDDLVMLRARVRCEWLCHSTATVHICFVSIIIDSVRLTTPCNGRLYSLLPKSSSENPWFNVHPVSLEY